MDDKEKKVFDFEYKEIEEEIFRKLMEGDSFLTDSEVHLEDSYKKMKKE